MERERRGQFRPEKAREVAALPRHWSVPAILLTLSRCNSHGYELMKRVANFGLAPMNPGTWYRTLRRMEEEGIIESRWDTSGNGAARRMYSITDAGEAYMDFWAEALKQYRLAMDTFLRLYGGHGGATSGREDISLSLQEERSKPGAHRAKREGKGKEAALLGVGTRSGYEEKVDCEPPTPLRP